MKTSKTTRERAILWWQKLASVDKYTMDKKYKLGPLELWTEENIEAMYLSEHPTETEKTIKEETSDMWFFNDIDGDNAVVSDNNGFILEAPDKATGKELCNRWNNYPSLAKENKELEEQNKLLREALQKVVSPCDTIMVVPAQSKVTLTFDIADIIEFQKLLGYK